MGLNTVIQIHHDNIHEINEDSEEFLTDLNEFINNNKNKSHLFNAMKSRHSSEKTIYMNIGNTLIEVNPYLKGFQSLKEYNPEFFKEVVNEFENTLKKIKNL